MLNLPKRDIPSIEFRRELPDFLAGGDPCYIEIDARAAGEVNIAYVEGMEQVALKFAVMSRGEAKIEDDEELVHASLENTKSIGRDRFRVLYDTCVIEWRSNMLDQGKPIICNRENFIALSEVKAMPEISDALVAFEKECREAGKVILKSDEDTVKN